VEISDSSFNDSPKNSHGKSPFPLARFLISLLAPAATALLVGLFYRALIGYLPWLRNYVVPQILGLVAMAIACAIYPGILLGRGKSEDVQILSFNLVCVLIVVNLICVAIAAFRIG
jgi:hypothetical protein